MLGPLLSIKKLFKAQACIFHQQRSHPEANSATAYQHLLTKKSIRLIGNAT